MPFQCNIVEGRTIEDVWREIMWCAVRKGFDYKVEVGSYRGQIRRQLDYAVLRVLEPSTRPPAVRVPEGCVIPAPTNEDKIWKYFQRYIIGSEKGLN